MEAEVLYLQRRAQAESKLAEQSNLGAVKAVHRQFAELYRARLGNRGACHVASA